MAPGLIVAAPSSGSGKTFFTLGLLRCLARQGVAVASAKVGPDYIDPAFHAAATGRPCFNLDGWAMRPATIAGTVAALRAAAGLVVCEGVMGLFDGANVEAGEADGSTADLAAVTGWPVILLVDVRGQAASAAALLRGFVHHRPDVRVVGVVFNQLGGPAHREMLVQACRRHLPDLPVLGHLPRRPDLRMPARHLGLVQAGEQPDLPAFLDAAAAFVAEHVDVAGLVALAAAGNELAGPPPAPLPPLGQRIAVARDDAFAFSYPLVLDGWRRAGAEIVVFSPLADEAPCPAADAVYLPGGYPELHAARLAAGRCFLPGLRAAVQRGAAVFGECGGYMVLGQSLIDGKGRHHAMGGLLPVSTSFAKPRLHLGYRRAELAVETPLGRVGATFRGHEFHYAAVVDTAAGSSLFKVADAAGRSLGHTGHVNGRVSGSFLHLVDVAAGS